MLKPGRYIISNVKAQRYVAPADTAVHPAPIITLPQGTRAYTFDVEEIHGRYYLIKAKDVMTGVIGDLVFAMDKDPLNKEWVITRRENHGPDVYTIEEPSLRRGWVVRQEEAQVACRPLSATKSLPPQYFPEGLWVFSRDPTSAE